MITVLQQWKHNSKSGLSEYWTLLHNLSSFSNVWSKKWWWLKASYHCNGVLKRLLKSYNTDIYMYNYIHTCTCMQYTCTCIYYKHNHLEHNKLYRNVYFKNQMVEKVMLKATCSAISIHVHVQYRHVHVHVCINM